MSYDVQERECALVKSLIARIDTLTKGDNEHFIHAATEEAVRLSKKASAKMFMQIIG